jgi:hypothetical protein
VPARTVVWEAARLRAASRVWGVKGVSPRRLNWKPSSREQGCQCSQLSFLATPNFAFPKVPSADSSMRLLYDDFLKHFNGNPNSQSIHHYGDPHSSRSEVVDEMVQSLWWTQITLAGQAPFTSVGQTFCVW